MRNVFLVFLASLAVFVLSFRPAVAAPGVWSAIGPDGGPISALAVDPRDPRTVYAGTAGAGVFRTTDGGASWESRSRGLEEASSVNALAVAPAPPGTVYAATQSGPFKSTDGGGTWAAATRGLPAGRRCLALLLDPRDPRRLYLATSAGVFRSGDGGASWQRSQPAGLDGAQSLAIDPTGAFLYAGTDTGEVWESVNGGRSFGPLGSGIPSYEPVNSLVIGPRDPRALVAGTSGGIYRLAPGPRRWVQVASSGPIVTLVTDPRSGRLLAGGVFGLASSRDQGFTWQPVAPGPADPLIQTLAAAPGALWAGTFSLAGLGGVFRSGDGGASWSPRSHGLRALGAQLTASPATPGLLFAAAGDPGFFRSRDGGRTWEAVSGLPAQSIVRQVEIDPGPRGTVYAYGRAAQVETVFRSTDQGETWTGNAIGDLGLARVRIDPRSPGRLWGAGFIRGLFVTDDAGVTWVAKSLSPTAPPWVLDVTLDPQDPSRLYAVGGEPIGGGPGRPLLAPRIYRSTDAGVTWERKDAGLTSGYADQMAIDPADPTRLYAVTGDGLFRSRDGGVNWQKVAAAPPYAWTVAVSPTHPSTLYVGSRLAAGAYQSLDGGDTFHPLDRGLIGQQLSSIWVDPRDPKRIYGTSASGLFTLAVP